MEINLRHGDPLALADQVFLFKRTIREAALRHDMYATFMAKPMSREPGSAMHIHQSVVDAETGKNIFSDEAGDPTPEFFAFIGGSQKYLPAVTCIAGALRQLLPPADPLRLGAGQRHVGLRQPHGRPARARSPTRRRGASRTASRPPTPIPISPSPPRSPAAISA